ncbi:unnamed protein product [Notodromas monacha]|uniref:Uncharacterized protein n=1 Tax=Notodromas monacha TaxID=399045 RepID=A0A7R9GE21_9CRUS|nr:unnamed protein product [Notodromas monacha]CAG0919149.1 unnamed protein product [Notodromas monacha]
MQSLPPDTGSTPCLLGEKSPFSGHRMILPGKLGKSSISVAFYLIFRPWPVSQTDHDRRAPRNNTDFFRKLRDCHFFERGVPSSLPQFLVSHAQWSAESTLHFFEAEYETG